MELPATYGRTLRWAAVVVYRRRWLFAAAFAAVVLLVGVYTLLMQPIFRAEATLLVTVNRAPLAVSPEVNPRQQPIPQVREEDLNSVVAMLGGRELVRATLAATRQAQGDGSGPGAIKQILRAPIDLFRSAYFGLHGRDRPNALDRQATAVAERLFVSPVRRSNVVSVAFEDPDPEWAARFLDRFLGTFLDAYAQAVGPTEAEAFFEVQSDLLATKLRASEDALKSFRDRSGIVSLEEQRKTVVHALAAAEAERDRVQVELAASERRLASIGETMPGVDRFVATARREVHEATSQIRGHLMLLEVERAEVLQDYTDDSLRVRRLDEQIAAARAALGRAESDPTVEREYGLSKAFEALSVERALETTRRAELEVRLAVLTEHLEQLRERALAFDTEALALERLERERAIDEDLYAAYLQQREAARLSNALNQSQILNLAVAAAPIAPSTPVRPKLRVNVMIGVLLGLFVAALAVFARDAAAADIDFPEDVERTTGLAVLGTVGKR